MSELTFEQGRHKLRHERGLSVSCLSADDMQVAQLGEWCAVVTERPSWRCVGLGEVEPQPAHVFLKPLVILQEVRWQRFHILLAW